MTQECDRCRTAVLLLAHTVKGWLCARCYHAEGRPPPAWVPLSPEELAAREAEVRDRMNARGGAQRNLVRHGRT